MMFINGRLRYALVAACLASISSPGLISARQSIVIGSLGMGYDYVERTHEHEGDETVSLEEDEGDRRDWQAWPEIELQSLGIHDSLSLRYAPVITYDELWETTDIDHYLYVSAERSMTRDWMISLADDFVLSSDPARYGTPFLSAGQLEPAGAPPEEPALSAEEEATPAEITRDLSGRRFWTNNFVLGTTYAYSQGSDIGIGYGFRVLRNESGDRETVAEYDEYDRHEFSGLWSHLYNPSWRSSLNLSYVKGLYDDIELEVPPELIGPETPSELIFVSRDLEEYRADVGLDYTRSTSDIFPLLYRFRGTEYEDFRQDIWAHELTAGWRHSFDARTRLEIGAGPSYVEAEDQDGEWGYNGFLNIARAYQHGDINARVSKRYEPRNFTGSRDTGMTDTLEARVDLAYQFTPNLSTTLFCLYRDEDILDPQGEYYLSALDGTDPLAEESVGDVSYGRSSYSVGAGASYTFWRWFVASVRYAYYNQDGDLPVDSYEDHRVTFVISASKELWRR